MPTSMTVVETSTCARPDAKCAIASCFACGRIEPCSNESSCPASSPARSRSSSAVAARALAYAEAMLLVDDRHRQRAKAHIRLDQRVRADHERELAAREPAQHLAPP